MIFMRSLNLMENRETSRKIWSLRVGPTYRWDKAPQKEIAELPLPFLRTSWLGKSIPRSAFQFLSNRRGTMNHGTVFCEG